MFKSSIFLASIVFIAIPQAFACPTPSSLPSPVAQVTVSGGFRIGNQDPYGVRVYSDGSVIGFRGANSIPLAQTSSNVSASFNSFAVSIVAGQLYDPNPLAPICADAPLIKYEAFDSQCDPITFSQQENCHDQFLLQGNAYYLRRVLDGWLQLASPLL